MNSLLAVIATAIFFICSGWYLTYLLPVISKIERFGLAFLLGAGLTTFFWFLGYQLGLPFNLYTLSIAGLTLASIGYTAKSLLNLEPTIAKPDNLTKYTKLLAITIVIALITAFVIGSYSPLTAWDSLALYDFRGHAIALDHDLSFIDAGAYFMSYPLMISLVHAIVYMLGGINAQGIHAVIFAALIAIVYGRMRQWTNPIYALLACALITTNSEIFSHATFAYTNLPYTTYLITGILYAISAVRTERSSNYFLLLSGLLIGLSSWIRSSEIFWVAGILLIIVQGWKSQKKLTSIVSVLIVILIRLSWSSFIQTAFGAINIPTDSLVNHLNLVALQRIVSNLREIYWYLYLNVISPYLGYWLITAPAILVCGLKRDLKLFYLIASIIISAGMVIVGVMIFSTYYTTWNEIGDSARRMMLFIVPLSFIAGVYSLYLMTVKKVK